MKTLSILGITGILCSLLVLIIGRDYLFQIIECAVENGSFLYLKIRFLYYIIMPLFLIIFLFLLFLSIRVYRISDLVNRNSIINKDKNENEKIL